MDCENDQEVVEKSHTEAIEDAMSKFESLELYRLTEQHRLVNHATTARRLMFEHIAAKLPGVESAVQKLDDMKDLECLRLRTDRALRDERRKAAAMGQ